MPRLKHVPSPPRWNGRSGTGPSGGDQSLGSLTGRRPMLWMMSPEVFLSLLCASSLPASSVFPWPGGRVCAVLWTSDNTRGCCGGVEAIAYVVATCEPSGTSRWVCRPCRYVTAAYGWRCRGLLKRMALTREATRRVTVMATAPPPPIARPSHGLAVVPAIVARPTTTIEMPALRLIER